MKIYQINIVYGEKSTGRIVADIKNVLESQGYKCRAAYGRGRGKSPEAYRIDTEMEVITHAALSRVFDNVGNYSKRATERLVSDIIRFNPDIIHLHNIHGYYVNIHKLFHFLREYGKPVVWTLHDCWAFTGHCAYFDKAGCDKWLRGCYNCSAKEDYPASFLKDNSRNNYENKKRLFGELDQLTLVTPSEWLQKLVKQSFLKGKDCVVINNGIDVDAFNYHDNNTFRSRHGIADSTKIILGVASRWAARKGLADFLRVRERLESEYLIVLVGLKHKTVQELPEGILGIEKTDSISQLADLYSTADVFVNPTYEDNFPTVNIEALACGTPVVTYDTGGSGECVTPLTGKIVPKGDVEKLIEAIREMTSRDKDAVVCRSWALRYSKEECYEKYIRLYERIFR